MLFEGALMNSALTEKVKASIERIKAFEPEEGYYLAFSGGKDSVVCKVLLGGVVGYAA